VPEITIIGSGFSGLSAACYLAQEGHKVQVFEKNKTLGGRARNFTEGGFTFDMGPSWYWMPGVFEDFFNDFGKKVEDYYQLKRLDPSYQIFFPNEVMKIPASVEELYGLFESIEHGSADKLKTFLDHAQYKYNVGMDEFVQKPSLSITEFMDFRIVKSALKLNMFSSLSKEVRKLFKDARLISLLEFPVLFLGAKPQKIPALYSLMNYADLVLGTWYPNGGMSKIVDGMVAVARELGVEFMCDEAVEKIHVDHSKVTSISTSKGRYPVSHLISAADYEHTEQTLIDQKKYKVYDQKYWNKRVMAPSSLLFYLGVSKKVPGLLHHNLFFDEDFDQHAVEIYDTPKWPTKPLFYVCCPSVTDDYVAPNGMENIFILMPLAPGIKDTESLREEYFEKIMKRLENKIGVSFKDEITVKRSFCINDFKSEYNSFKGNAYGLANTLFQTAFLKPQMKSKKLSNLLYTGQLTVPGPGVPPSIISGKVVAKKLMETLT